jgi:hypothetical protein
MSVRLSFLGIALAAVIGFVMAAGPAAHHHAALLASEDGVELTVGDPTDSLIWD